MNTIFALSCFPPIWTIERHGRRPMMFWTAGGCGICLIVFIAVQSVKTQTTALGWVAVAAIIIYNIIFGYGWLGPPWVYGPEVCLVLLKLGSSFANFCRLLLSSSVILPVLLARRENGSPRSLSCLVVAPASTRSVLTFGSGRPSFASSPWPLCTSTAPRYVFFEYPD